MGRSLLSVDLVAVLGLPFGEAGYGRLNKYLVDNVDDDSVESNLDAATEWLREGERWFHNTPRGDIVQFIDLKDLVDQNKCDERSYNIMLNNVVATDLLSLMENKNVVRRVDRVVQDY